MKHIALHYFLACCTLFLWLGSSIEFQHYWHMSVPLDMVHSRYISLVHCSMVLRQDKRLRMGSIFCHCKKIRLDTVWLQSIGYSQVVSHLQDRSLNRKDIGCTIAIVVGEGAVALIFVLCVFVSFPPTFKSYSSFLTIRKRSNYSPIISPSGFEQQMNLFKYWLLLHTYPFLQALPSVGEHSTGLLPLNWGAEFVAHPKSLAQHLVVVPATRVHPNPAGHELSPVRTQERGFPVAICKKRMKLTNIWPISISFLPVWNKESFSSGSPVFSSVSIPASPPSWLQLRTDHPESWWNLGKQWGNKQRKNIHLDVRNSSLSAVNLISRALCGWCRVLAAVARPGAFIELTTVSWNKLEIDWEIRKIKD